MSTFTAQPTILEFGLKRAHPLDCHHGLNVTSRDILIEHNYKNSNLSEAGFDQVLFL